MQLSEIFVVSEQLQQLYGERFPGLTASMAVLWLEELRGFELAIMQIAIRQWARKNTFRVPGLDDLVTLAIELTDVQEEQRRWQAALERPIHQRGVSQILGDAADAVPYDGQRWAHLHVEMVRKHIGGPGTYLEAAALTEQHAIEHPEDAEACQRAIQYWKAQHGKQPAPYYSHYGREPGDEES